LTTADSDPQLSYDPARIKTENTCDPESFDYVYLSFSEFQQ